MQDRWGKRARPCSGIGREPEYFHPVFLIQSRDKTDTARSVIASHVRFDQRLRARLRRGHAYFSELEPAEGKATEEIRGAAQHKLRDAISNQVVPGQKRLSESPDGRPIQFYRRWNSMLNHSIPNCSTRNSPARHFSTKHSLIGQRPTLAMPRGLLPGMDTSFRYCHPWKKWLIYDEAQWAIDMTGGIQPSQGYCSQYLLRYRRLWGKRPWKNVRDTRNSQSKVNRYAKYLPCSPSYSLGTMQSNHAGRDQQQECLVVQLPKRHHRFADR